MVGSDWCRHGADGEMMVSCFGPSLKTTLSRQVAKQKLELKLLFSLGSIIVPEQHSFDSKTNAVPENNVNLEWESLLHFQMLSYQGNRVNWIHYPPPQKKRLKMHTFFHKIWFICCIYYRCLKNGVYGVKVHYIVLSERWRAACSCGPSSAWLWQRCGTDGVDLFSCFNLILFLIMLCEWSDINELALTLMSNRSRQQTKVETNLQQLFPSCRENSEFCTVVVVVMMMKVYCFLCLCYWCVCVKAQIFFKTL